MLMSRHFLPLICSTGCLLSLNSCIDWDSLDQTLSSAMTSVTTVYSDTNSGSAGAAYSDDSVYSSDTEYATYQSNTYYIVNAQQPVHSRTHEKQRPQPQHHHPNPERGKKHHPGPSDDNRKHESHPRKGKGDKPSSVERDREMQNKGSKSPQKDARPQPQKNAPQKETRPQTQKPSPQKEANPGAQKNAPQPSKGKGDKPSRGGDKPSR